MSTKTTRTNYEMFSKAGNYSVRRMVDRIINAGEDGRIRRPQLENEILKGIAKVGTRHGEVYDTAVREVIYWEINERLCKPQRWEEV